MKQLNLQKLQNNLRKKFLKFGVKMIGPETIFFSKDTKIGKNVIIEPYVVIGQKVKIGQDALVTPNIIEKTQYGGIIGKVVSKPKPVISSEQLANMVPYEGFTSYLTNTYEIPVAFQVGLYKTKNGEFKWSGNSIPPYEIREGTTANVSVTTLAKPPISYIIPSIRKIIDPFAR